MELTRKEYRLLKWINREDIASSDRLGDNLGRARLLKSAGYLVMNEVQNQFVVAVTVEGRHAMEVYKEYVRDRRWTRGLSIAAIVVAIGTMLVTSPLLSEVLSQWIELLLP